MFSVSRETSDFTMLRREDSSDLGVVTLDSTTDDQINNFEYFQFIRGIKKRVESALGVDWETNLPKTRSGSLRTNTSYHPNVSNCRGFNNLQVSYSNSRMDHENEEDILADKMEGEYIFNDYANRFTTNDRYSTFREYRDEEIIGPACQFTNDNYSNNGKELKKRASYALYELEIKSKKEFNSNNNRGSELSPFFVMLMMVSISVMYGIYIYKEF
ncbi:hypothetical protein K502DRAFT_369005 [Neoconidiobolus thromboides FSU 785]|nr:hypothetical protein K502DRAFT_369005 [Neoconidiobolus thromboides FSU 785]